MPYDIEFAQTASEQIKGLKTARQSRLLDEIEVQLSHQPLNETRNRKRLRPNPLAPWELRVDEMRAFYDVDEDTKTVEIVAVGVKRGNKLYIEGKELEI